MPQASTNHAGSGRGRLRLWLWIGRVVPAVPVLGAAALSVGAVLSGSPVAIVVAAVVLVVAVASVAAPSHLPQGYRLVRGEAPHLDSELAGLTDRVGLRALDAVVVDGDFNISLTVVPRSVPVLRARVVLVLGLPVLQALTEPQLRAVLAHEIAALAGGADRFEQVLERDRHLWMTINASGATGVRTGWLLRRFAAWYVPRLARRSRGAAAAHERYADRVDQDVAGAHVAVNALLAVIVRSERLARLWREIRWWTTEQPRPPGDMYSVVVPEWIAAPLEPALVRRQLRRELSRPAPHARDFPSMLDRVHELGEPGDVETIVGAHADALAAGITKPAAAVLLDAGLEGRIARVLDMHWSDSLADNWREAREAARVAAAAALDLEAASVHRRLSTDEQRELAVLLWAAFGDDRAEAAYRDLLGADERDLPARLGLARLSLARGTDEWQELLAPLLDADIPSADRAEARTLYVEGLLESGDAAQAATLEATWHRS